MIRQFFTRLARRWRLIGVRELIVNADDFGMSEAVTAGIIRAHDNGIVTSTSLMVRRAAAATAAQYARANRSLSVGLHVDLGEWVCRDGEWRPSYIVAPLDDAAAVRAEAAAQLQAFRELVGEDPTHLDSHQHVHREEPVHGALVELASALNVPLRHYDRRVKYCGRFYGQEKFGEPNDAAIGVKALIAVLADLPAGTTELCCHPGEGAAADEQYAAARPIELATLCDPRVRAAVAREGITLRSFRGLTATR